MKVLKRVAVLLLFVLCFFIGLLNSGLKLFDDGSNGEYVLTSTIKGIEIYEKDANKKNMNLYMNNLVLIPDELLENCSRIYFADEDLNDKFDLGFATVVAAVSIEDEIYVDTSYFEYGVLVHEMYHVFDYANGWITEKEDFKRIYNIYKDIVEVSPGNRENVYEFFASYGEMFTLEREALERNEIFAFFSGLGL